MHDIRCAEPSFLDHEVLNNLNTMSSIQVLKTICEHYVFVYMFVFVCMFVCECVFISVCACMACTIMGMNGVLCMHKCTYITCAYM